MKRIICIILSLILVLPIIGCGDSEDNEVLKDIEKIVKAEEKYEVVEYFDREGITFKFSYDEEKKLVTIADALGKDPSRILIFVNDDGAITSMYGVLNGRQDTIFETKGDSYPKTYYNDAGGISEVKYKNIEFTFSYNNYIDNTLTAISYEETSYYGHEDFEETVYVEEFEKDFTNIKYTKTNSKCFRMFNSLTGIITMFDVLESTYQN